MIVVKNALAKFVVSLIVWYTKIVAILKTNQTMKRLSFRQQKEYENSTQCNIICNKFVESDATGLKGFEYDNITS